MIRQAKLMAEASASVDIDAGRSSQVSILIWADVQDGPVTTLDNCGYIIGGHSPEDNRQCLKNYSIDLLKSRINRKGDTDKCNLWKVTAQYGKWNPAEVGPPSSKGSPLSRPARWRLEWEKRPEPVWQDVDGKACVNTAGSPYDPPIEIDTLIGILTVERNERADVDIGSILSNQGKTNDAPWLAWDTECVKVAPISVPAVEYDQDSNTYFLPFAYVFEINPRTWLKRPVQAGYEETLAHDPGPVVTSCGWLPAGV